MTICCHVATMFKDQYWNPIFKLENHHRNRNVEVPDAIVQDPIFHQLIAEGSLEVIITVAQGNRLEKDPLDGIDASGKRRSALNAENPVDSAPVFAVPAVAASNESVASSADSTASTKPSGKKSSSKSRKAEPAPVETEAKSANVADAADTAEPVEE